MSEIDWHAWYPQKKGLDRKKCRRQDDITVFPWKHIKCSVWNATIVDTFTESHIISRSIEYGSSADTA